MAKIKVLTDADELLYEFYVEDGYVEYAVNYTVEATRLAVVETERASLMFEVDQELANRVNAKLIVVQTPEGKAVTILT